MTSIRYESATHTKRHTVCGILAYFFYNLYKKISVIISSLKFLLLDFNTDCVQIFQT